MQRSDLLVWMDLEMTSLQDARIDKITEIAVVLTDQDLKIIAEGPDIVIHVDAELFERSDPVFRNFHKINGIEEAVAKSNTTKEEAEAQVLEFIKSHVAPNTAPLCGNSIHIDRHFLRIHMRELESYLFYRCIDVSSIKELAKRWAPKVYQKTEALKKEKTHRAKDDILQSIEELRFYREQFFTPR